MKKKLLFGAVMVSMLMLIPSIISAEANNDFHNHPKVKPQSAFQIIVHPPEEALDPLETIEITGTHKLIPGIFDNLLPTLWVSQYSTLGDKSPDWVEVTFPETNILTPPDGRNYNFSIYLTLTNNAPMNTITTITIKITTGKFMRTIFPSWFPLCNEFNLDQEILVRTSEW